MQPHPLTSVMQLAVTAAAISFAVWTWREHRNADLVKIGVSVLRVDPEKERQISAAREWALNLIDENAGGVKFTPEARAQLLRKRLEYYADPGWATGSWDSSWDTGHFGSTNGPQKNPVPSR